MADDNVMDLLDSLDVKQGSQKTKPKKSSSKRKEGTKKAAGEDILGFLDELDKPQNLKEATESKDKSVAPPSESTHTETEVKESKGEETKANIEPKSQNADEDGSTQKENTDDVSDTAGEDPLDDDETPTIDPVASLTSWWSRNKGGIWSTASRASSSLQDAMNETVKQARQAEATFREEQPQFSLNSLQTRLTSVLNTIIPPISRHEQLQIHIFHDMVGYPSIDKLLYEVFDYVMDQVEGGGDLNMVVQKGKERHRVGSDHDVNRDLNLVRCSAEDATKLARANIETISDASKASQVGDPNIRISEIYISIQPVITPVDGKLYFMVLLLDKEHEIEIPTLSQGMPGEWAHWLDGSADKLKDAAYDPREWVFGWIEDALNLSFGVTAQKYVTLRMGLVSEAEKSVKKSDE